MQGKIHVDITTNLLIFANISKLCNHPVRREERVTRRLNLYIWPTRQTGISPRIDMRWRDFPRGLRSLVRCPPRPPARARERGEECFRIVGRFPLRIWLSSHTLLPFDAAAEPIDDASLVVRDRVCPVKFPQRRQAKR